MSDPTLVQALGNATLRPILEKWAIRHRIDDQVDFLIDVTMRKSNRDLYDMYFAPSASKPLNLADGMFLTPIRQYAAEGDGGYAKMSKLISNAFKEIYKVVNGHFVSSNQAFVDDIDYLKFRVKGRAPALSQVVTALKIKGAKADQFNAFLKIYLQPRSIEDAYQAYVGMQKFANKANLDKTLTHAGKPSLPIVQQYQALQLVPSIKKYQDEATDYLITALATVKRKGKPGNPIEVTRMFNSGRQRVEKANNDYVKAVRLDKTFAKKQAALAAEKKKIDELWGDYRELLGK